MQSGIAEAVTRIIEPMLEGMGIELVEIQFRREAPGMVLRLTLDKQGGIGIDDCAKVSRETGFLLEVENLIEGHYHLEVSSPGLDRPLKTERDFNRNRQLEVKVTLKDPAGRTVIGTILGATENMVTLQADSEQLTIPLNQIAKAKLVF